MLDFFTLDAFCVRLKLNKLFLTSVLFLSFNNLFFALPVQFYCDFLKFQLSQDVYFLSLVFTQCVCCTIPLATFLTHCEEIKR